MKVNKSKLFKIAHAILRKQEALNFSEALKKAWKTIKVYTSMLTGVVEFTFKKVNGEIRKAVGTLYNISYTPKGNGTGKERPADLICYFDVEKQAFRSFKASSII